MPDATSGYLYGAQAGLDLASGYFASQNIKESAQLNQDIANQNAKFADLDAYDAITEGYTKQAQYQGVIDKTLGEQQLAQTAQDVDVHYGTASAAQAETRFTGQLNLMNIQKDAQEKALGYQNQARNLITQGVVGKAQGDAQASAAEFSGITGAVGAGLTGYKESGYNVGLSGLTSGNTNRRN